MARAAKASRPSASSSAPVCPGRSASSGSSSRSSAVWPRSTGSTRDTGPLARGARCSLNSRPLAASAPSARTAAAKARASRRPVASDWVGRGFPMSQGCRSVDARMIIIIIRTMTSRPLTLALLAALACPAFAAVAQTPSTQAISEAEAATGPAADAPTDDARQLDRVVVTATRTARAIVDVPNTGDEIDRERMDELLVQDLKDLFRYEPGITVTNNFGRFGIGDIRIRGLGGNRVRIQTDGIAVSDAFEIGSFSNANRNFVDLDTLKRVKVVRGPTSSMYGSDALGGTVAFVTKDPADYLDPGETSHYALKLGYDGESDGRFGGFTGAFGGDRWSGLVALGYRQGHERDNRGEAGGTGNARTRPNPQDNDGRSVLAKLVHQPSWHQRFKLTVEGTEDRADTELLTSLGLQPMTGATNERVGAHDEQRRTRVSFSHELDLDGGFVDTIDWQAYVQD